MGITIPTQTSTGSLLYTEFNQLVEAFKDNTRDFTGTGSGLKLIGNTLISGTSTGIIIPLLARTNISGGMWVSCSGGFAQAGPASIGAPVGVAQNTVASGGRVDVIITGVVSMNAEGTIATGEPVRVGAGAGLNCVVSLVAGSAMSFATFSSAASGTVSPVSIVLR